MANLAEIKATTTWLQGIGAALGKPAGEIVAGDVLVWNYGSTSKVVAVRPVGKASVEVVEEYTSDGVTKTYARRFRRNRVVACQINGQTRVYSTVTKEMLS